MHAKNLGLPILLLLVVLPNEILKLVNSLVHCTRQSVVNSFVMLLLSEMAAMVGLSTHHVHVLSLHHRSLLVLHVLLRHHGPILLLLFELWLVLVLLLAIV